jgi:putative membrane protein
VSEWQRLDRRTLWLTAIYLIGLSLAAGVPTALLLLQGGAAAWLVLLVVGGAAVVLVSHGVLIDWVRWWYTEYRVTEERVERRFTFVFHTHKSVPRERVRSVDVKATIVHRLLGLATVRIGTGQQDMLGKVSITFDPVAREAAEALRAELLHKGHAGPEVELARFRWAWIRYAPVAITTPALGAGAFGLVMQLSEWFNLQVAVVDFIRDLFRELPLIPLLGVIVAIGLVLGAIGSLGLWVELWWDFRLTRQSGNLLVRRGLLTRRSLTLEERRLRGIEVVEPIGARLAGGARLDAVASGFTVSIDERRNDPRTLLPVVPRQLAHQVAAEILREQAVPGRPASEASATWSAPTESAILTAHPPAARRRRLLWAVGAAAGVALVLAVLGLLLVEALLHLAWISAVVLVPAAVWIGLDAYRALGHGIAGDYLVARRGSVRRSTVALRRDGVIGWVVTSSPLQRRAGLVTLTATTAANRGGYRIPDAGMAQALTLADEAVPDLIAPFLEADQGVGVAPRRPTRQPTP